MWNHFDNQNRPRTINSLKAYNGKLKKFIKVSHPNIFLAIEALQAEEVTSGAEYHRALGEAKPGPRRKLYVTKHGTFGAYKDLLLAGEITLDVYMKRLTAMMVINKKKVRREGVNSQNISSTGDSDSGDTEESTSSEDESSLSSTAGISSTIVDGVAELAIVRCDCKTKCMTKRCPCVLANSHKCSASCHPSSKTCENK
jgi:hypothetical protein